MKNDQKNPKNLFMALSCMFQQPKATVYENLNKWHLNIHIWNLNLNLGFKPTPCNLLLVALAQITANCHVMIMHHIMHCIDCVLPCLPVLSPLGKRGSDDEFNDTDEELYYLQKCQASKKPLFILIQSHSLASALFYCIKTTRSNCYVLR